MMLGRSLASCSALFLQTAVVAARPFSTKVPKMILNKKLSSNHPNNRAKAFSSKSQIRGFRENDGKFVSRKQRAATGCDVFGKKPFDPLDYERDDVDLDRVREFLGMEAGEAEEGEEGEGGEGEGMEMGEGGEEDADLLNFENEQTFNFDPKDMRVSDSAVPFEKLTEEEREKYFEDMLGLNTKVEGSEDDPEAPFHKSKDFEKHRLYDVQKQPQYRDHRYHGAEYQSLVTGDRPPTEEELAIASTFERELPSYSGYVDKTRFGEFSILRHRSHTVVRAGGRVNSFSTIVVVGDGKGTVGIGYGKSKALEGSTRAAYIDAMKHLVAIDLVQGTISHPVKFKNKASLICLWPRPPGYGVVSSPLAFEILSAAGITDITCKVHGSHNILNTARGIVEALRFSEDPRTTALKLGVKYEDKHVLYNPYGQTKYY